MSATVRASVAAGGAVAKGLARAAVELQRDQVEVLLAVHREVTLPGQVLSEQSVGVLRGGALPRTPRSAEVDRHVTCDGELLVGGHLRAPIAASKAVFLFSPDQLPAEAAPDRCTQPPQSPLARTPFGALPPCGARLLSGLVDPWGLGPECAWCRRVSPRRDQRCLAPPGPGRAGGAGGRSGLPLLAEPTI
jgi:hypothetical protein